MNTELITITPHMASKMLEYNQGNRKIRTTNLKYWENILRSGDYQPTHQGLAIEGTKSNYVRILDGQHRLQAVVNTGITAMFNVTWGCHPEYVYKNTDGGAPRSNQDRTQLPKKEMEVAAFLLRCKKQGKLLPDDIISMHGVFSYDFKSFKTGVARLSTTPIRSAFCMWGSTSDIGNLFHNFISGNFHELPNSLCALYKKCVTGKFNGYRGGLDIFCMTMKALENQDMKRIVPPIDSNNEARVYINKYTK